jgi:hypothetical protein
MAITAKQLADGQLPNANGDLYMSTGVTTYVKNITLHNTDASAHVCTLKMLPSAGVARVIASVNLAAGYTFYHTDPLVLDSGDKLQGDDGGAAGNKIDYSIYGATE